MSKELDLKSGTATKPRRVKMVKMTHDINFFGISGSQISQGMSGINLEWNGSVVIVTSDSYPGESRWLFPSAIAYISWVDA